MDFILFHLLTGTQNEWIMFSYDITCQWSWNFPQRMLQLPDSMQLLDKQIHLLQFAIPKFHISTHGVHCQTNFSLNNQQYMARTDGEDLE
jgi:hypothetical protein